MLNDENRKDLEELCSKFENLAPDITEAMQQTRKVYLIASGALGLVLGGTVGPKNARTIMLHPSNIYMEAVEKYFEASQKTEDFRETGNEIICELLRKSEEILGMTVNECLMHDLELKLTMLRRSWADA